jgi:hypothetical protein
MASSFRFRIWSSRRITALRDFSFEGISPPSTAVAPRGSSAASIAQPVEHPPIISCSA